MRWCCQDFLRGRMGASFYHAMGFLDLVASSADQYVDIAVRLGTDRLYRHKCATVIKHLSPVIWEREEVRGRWLQAPCAKEMFPSASELLFLDPVCVWLSHNHA